MWLVDQPAKKVAVLLPKTGQKTKTNRQVPIDAVGVCSSIHCELNKQRKIVAALSKKRKSETIVQSQQKMLGKNSEVFPVHLYNQFQHLLKSVTGWQKIEPGVEILYINHKDVIHNPEKVAEQVAKFIGKPLDVNAMASVVDPNLYRNKYQGE